MNKPNQSEIIPFIGTVDAELVKPNQTKTAEQFKLDKYQRAEVNYEIEQAQDDLEAVIWRLVGQRDRYANEMQNALAERDQLKARVAELLAALS